MKTKTPVSTKKQSITVKDLTTKKNPKGGGFVKIEFSDLTVSGRREKQNHPPAPKNNPSP